MKSPYLFTDNKFQHFAKNIPGILTFSNFLYECSPIWLSLLGNNQPTYLTKFNIGKEKKTLTTQHNLFFNHDQKKKKREEKTKSINK
jgi:hypothetical protein